jgi:hypothetical protein
MNEKTTRDPKRPRHRTRRYRENPWVAEKDIFSGEISRWCKGIGVLILSVLTIWLLLSWVFMVIDEPDRLLLRWVWPRRG